MCPGMDEDPDEASNIRKTAVIDRELRKLDLDVVGLQETRLAGAGSIREENYTFFWQGKSPEERREYGVGFAIINSLVKAIDTPVAKSERIHTVRVNTSSGKVHIICAYAPTLGATENIKDAFYGLLQQVIDDIPSGNALYLLGDFNARVGADDDSWPTCLGPHGVGKMNSNGQRLLELCANNHLCVTNTFFQSKRRHHVSWRHPRSGHWHQLDLVLARRRDLPSVLHTRSYHSADCDTDHILVVSKLKLTPKKVYNTKTAGAVKINTTNTNNPEKCARFSALLQNAEVDESNAESLWTALKSTIHTAAVSSFGKRTVKSQDWYDQAAASMEPYIEAKNKAYLQHNKRPTRQTATALKESKAKVQKLSRFHANNYWNNLCENIQAAADTGNIGAMYEGINKAIGRKTTKVAPLKSVQGDIITDQQGQLDRWVEHYSSLYSEDADVSQDGLDALPSLPTMEELDEEPSLAELEKAIDGLKSGKAPGADGIPPEVLKCGKDVLLPHLHKLLIHCWREGIIPQDMRNANIVTLYKNKGDKGDCNNYRGISLLSITGKVFARVLLGRLQQVADRVYPETQCGFRAKRSTIDMIFSLRQIQEKCREQQKPLFVAFVDLTKAFDTVSRSGLFQILHKVGCPPRLLDLIRSFHDNMTSTVSFDGSTSDSFDIRRGVKQGCVLAPTLFGIFFSVLLTSAFTANEEGVYLHTRSDGGLFKLSRLKAKTKRQTLLVRELLFADDAALVAHSAEQLQGFMNSLSAACKDFALTISVKKTVVLQQGTAEPIDILLDGSRLVQVDTFTYLGSTVSSSLSLEQELNGRIGKASTTFGRLCKRGWNNRKLTLKTKVSIYRACVLSTLLYGSETWTTYSAHERKLESFHLRCLRRILGIRWQDKITNVEVLRRAGISTLTALLQQRRLRWLGHVRRMSDTRLPKAIMYGEVADAKRPTGRPKLRFSDVCKRDMNECGIDCDSWEKTAEDRPAWRTCVRKGVAARDASWVEEQQRKRDTRKATTALAPADDSFVCPTCSRACRSRIGLLSHQKKCDRRA